MSPIRPFIRFSYASVSALNPLVQLFSRTFWTTMEPPTHLRNGLMCLPMDDIVSGRLGQQGGE